MLNNGGGAANVNITRGAADPPLDFQLLRETRENLAAGLRHYDHVFVPDSAEPGIIKPRLDRQHLSIFQGDLLQPRIFVNLQTEPVAGAMEKSNVLPFANFGGI